MLKIAEYLKNKYGRWGWIGQRAHDGCGINSILPLDFIISCDLGTEINDYFREDDHFSVEKEHGIRRDWSNEDLNTSLKGVLGRNIIERWNSYGERVNLLCYRSIKRLETGSKRLKCNPRLYAMPQSLKRHFDNKLLLYRTLPKLGIDRIPGSIHKLGKVDFKELRSELSSPFVIQFPYSSSGQFTFIINNNKEYSYLRQQYPDQSVITSKYINGFSLNVNAVIVSTKNGFKTICSFPSVQITGAPECSNFPTTFCGNDFAAAGDLGRNVIKEVEDIVCIIGKWMGRSGYRGIFGMDMIVAEGKVYPVEINPRFQNSTSLFTSLRSMSRAPEYELFLLHIAEFLQCEDKVMKKYISDFPEKELMRPLKGAQIIVHNRLKRNIADGKLSHGLYRMKNDKIVFVKKAASIESCSKCDDILITCGVPGENRVIEPNAPLFKVQMRKNVLNPSDKISLTKGSASIIRNIYKKLALKEAKMIETRGV